ncbi:MAG TPA: alginate export family protein [Candidatus Binatia bacterium]|nr:alginate export family protein [Candidatus Binatia bacterium]
MAAALWAIALAAAASDARAFALGPVETDGPADSKIRLEIYDRVRGEFVDWFNPKPGNPQPIYRYNFFANKFQLGVRIKRDPVEAFAQLQHSLLDDLPGAAQGPGGLYFANTHDTFQEQAFLRQGWARLKGASFAPGLALLGGRFLYRDGTEVVPKDRALAWIVNTRVAERLIGPFDYTNIGRSFDGGTAAWDDDLWNAAAFYLRPDTGGYEINAGHAIAQINVAGASASLKPSEAFPGSLARLFAIYYADSRNVVWVDNRPLEDRKADHDSSLIWTLGTDFMHVEPIGPGQADVLLWGLGQFGHWQSLDHRAWAFAAEGGYQLPDVPWQPWMRVGFDMGSGDDDPNDGLHTTFFQILPTARIYAQFPFYNMMDNQDAFAQILLWPAKEWHVRSDVHVLRVSDEQDLLYSGGGANKGDAFGFSGLPANGNRDVGVLLDLAVSWKPRDFFTLYAYYGHVFGDGVISANYEGKSANYGYLEGTISF